MKNKQLPIVNFDVIETWTMTCPVCDEEQDAPFNKQNPMQPMEVSCIGCDKEFILTYERDD